jgi:hypothetical protein
MNGRLLSARFRDRSRIVAAAYWGCAVAVFGWAALLRFRLPLTPIADPDTWGYLSPAVGKLIGTGFLHCLRNYLYPGWLLVLLKCFHDFRAITVAQHCAGLAAGAVFLLVWRELRRFGLGAAFPVGLYDFIGLFAAAVYLTASSPIAFESDLRPEALAPFLGVLNIYFSLLFLRRWRESGWRRIPILCGGGIVCSSILWSMTKPSFALASLLGAALLIGSLSSPAGRVDKLKLGLLSLALAFAFSWPEHVLARDDPHSRIFVATDLFVIHANIIQEQIDADLKAAAPLPYDAGWLRAVNDSLRAAIEESREAQKFPRLGFDPDFLMYSERAFHAEMQQRFGGDLDRLRSFYHWGYWRAWFRRPRAMVGKIAGQLGVFYRVPCPAYERAKYRLVGREYARASSYMEGDNLRVLWADYPPALRLMRDSADLGAQPLVLKHSRFARRVATWLGNSYLALALVTCALALCALFGIVPRRWRWPIALVFCAYLYNLTNSVEVSVLHCLEDERYQRIQFIFATLAQFAALVLIADVVSAVAARLRFTSRADAPRNDVRSARRDDR